MNIFIVSVIVIVIIRSIYAYRNYDSRYYTSNISKPQVDDTDIVFDGRDLHLTNDQLHTILQKRNGYYAALELNLQSVFIKRLRTFMNEKTFIIKSDKGVKDMPVLICGTAMQLLFGLPDYKLPFYKYIRIYPEEYFSDRVFFRVLEGNVQDNIISIAWNFYLKGYENREDGANVGLHEMSHALYNQKMVIESDHTKRFCKQYNHLVQECSLASQLEKSGSKDFYSEYADTDLQEFWAESVELFFEKTEEMYQTYPTVFEAITILLNQDPRNKQNPLLGNNLSFNERLEKVMSRLFK